MHMARFVTVQAYHEVLRRTGYLARLGRCPYTRHALLSSVLVPRRLNDLGHLPRRICTCTKQHR